MLTLLTLTRAWHFDSKLMSNNSFFSTFKVSSTMQYILYYLREVFRFVANSQDFVYYERQKSILFM